MSIKDEARYEADRRQEEQYKSSLADYAEAGYESPVTEWEQAFWESGYRRGAEVGAEWQESRKLETNPKPERLDPELRADLIEFARDRIESVWADVPEGVDAATLASNVVAAQEFCWMSRQVPVPVARKVEAALSDTDREVLAKLLAEHRPSVWRSFSNDATILRCCGIDFGRLSGKPRKTDRSATELWEEHLADALSAADFSGTPHPVQVEVSKDKRMAVAAILVSNGIKPHDPAYYHLIDALTAALGGTE